VKSLVATFVTALVSAAATVGHAAGGGTSGASELLLIGPVEAVNTTQTRAVVLGQKISISPSEGVAVGDTVAVYGTESADGTISATRVQAQGLYVAGATTVFLAGVVQKVQPAVGHVVVNGLTVDLTPAMAQGAVLPTIGSEFSLLGTQPVGRGSVVVNGVSGSGLSANGVSGSGKLANGVSGSGRSANGVSGSGKVANGVSGSGLSANGVSGSGLSANGVSGSGLSANGVSGSGLSANGVSGSGKLANGVSGSGLQ
jgi:hypothetical protein